MSDFAKVTREEGWIRRVPKGDQPELRLLLSINQEIVSVEMREWRPYDSDMIDRKTADWKYVVYVRTRLSQ